MSPHAENEQLRRVGGFAVFAALALAAANASATPADALAAAIGMGVETNDVHGCVLTNGTDTLKLSVGSRRAELNRRTVWLNAPAAAKGDMPSIDAADFDRLVVPIFAPPVSTGGTTRVHIDAGHGGEDAGCISTQTSMMEKDLVLALSMRVGELLASRGFDVTYTRTNDTFATLSERTAIVSNNCADAFVSIHANFAANGTARGIEIYTLPIAGMAATASDASVSNVERKGNAFDRESSILGYEVQRRMPGALDEGNRGLRHARYQVLRDASCPAILVEVGFLSNRSDSINLSSDWYRERIARAIADGVSAFADRTRTNDGQSTQ